MALRFELSEFGGAFATRGRGREVREELLRRVDGSQVAILDFTGVSNVTYSFADEFAGKLAADDSLRLEIENMAPNVARSVDRAIERRTAVTC